MDSERFYGRVTTIIYALVVAATVALMLLLGLPVARLSHFGFSLGALLIGETAIYAMVMMYHANRKRARRMIPGYLAFGTVTVLYLAAVLVVILVFSILLDVSAFTYALIHFILLAVAGAIAGCVALFTRYSEQDEQGATGAVGPRYFKK